jgi:hypothetical protein
LNDAADGASIVAHVSLEEGSVAFSHVRKSFLNGAQQTKIHVALERLKWSLCAVTSEQIASLQATLV